MVSDTIASFLLGIQLLFGAYLPVVHGIQLHGCIMIVSEAFKLAGIIVTVYHLLIMVMMHLAGVTSPVKFKKVGTLIRCFNTFTYEYTLMIHGIFCIFN